MSLLRAIWRAWLSYQNRSANCDAELLAQGQTELDTACDVWRSRRLNRCQTAQRALDKWCQRLPKRSLLFTLRDVVSALVIATLGAIAIRSCWFELYHVPTGSMRPTILEQDRLIVTKTAFGLNRPLSAHPLLFDADLLKRGQIVTFTSHGIDVEGKTQHFGIFPGYRRFVKRLWAKGGDRVYFYGGEIYILDNQGRSWRLPGDDPDLDHLEVIPLLSFQGRVKERARSGQPDLVQTHFGIEMKGEQKGALPWGLDNYFLGRLIKSADVSADVRQKSPSSKLWLQLLHHARHAEQEEKRGRFLPHWTLQESYLALTDEHIETLQRALFTSRFTVRKGVARRAEMPASRGIELGGVPDGIYEFSRGAASSIGFGGTASSLSKSHPLYRKELLPQLFNGGIDFAPERCSSQLDGGALPLRYLYFRNENLMAMASLVMSAQDPHLVALKEHERDRKLQNPDYIPLLDEGAPWKGELIDQQALQKRGLSVPSGHALLLGDNSPRSSDSRDFGFVPQTNIQGSPLVIFWPLSSAKKGLQRPSLPHLTLYRLIIWTSLATAAIVAHFVQSRRMKKAVDQRPWHR